MTHTDQTDPSSIEMQLAMHATRVEFSQLSAHSAGRIATFVADTLSVGMAGTTVPEAQTLLNTWIHEDGAATTAVWGTGQRLAPELAIMANAFNVHCQEFDCVHEGAVVHAMATLLPVLVAEVEQRQRAGKPVSGQAFMAAIAAGIDVACTLGLAAKQAMHFFRPATAGGFGAVAGLARLRELDADTLVRAWGFQLAQTSGTMQGHREGSPVLPLQVSFNARAAWQACALAQTGLPALAHPIMGECGYLAMFEAESDITLLMETLGQTWRIDEFSHKPYPSGRATHGGIEGLLQLLKTHDLAGDAIESVVVTGPSLISRLVDRPAVAAPSPNYARLCMPYVLANIIQHGELLPEHYREAERMNADTLTLARQVHMAVDDNPDPNAFTPVTVTVRSTQGQTYQTTIDHMLASPQRPLSADQCRQKFLQCCALAAEPPSQPECWFDQLMTLGEFANVATLIPR